MPDQHPEIVLVRHGETDWSRSGRHTGFTDIPLNDEGRRQAKMVGTRLRTDRFVTVLSSPLRRAFDTCALAGFADGALVRDDLKEWDYGRYDGKTTAEIRREHSDWSLWNDGAPGGETPQHVSDRADRIIAELRTLTQGKSLVFSHGHMLRVIAARWVGLPARDGKLIALGTAALSVIGYERDTPVITRWNDDSHLHQR